MAVPEIPKTFPFRSTQVVSEPFQCLFDLRARNGRCKILENFETTEANSKTFGFSLMVIEFTLPDSAVAFMGDEEARFAHLGDSANERAQHGDKSLIAIKKSPFTDAEADVFYTVRIGILVFRIAIGLMRLTKEDDPIALTAETVKSILHIYRDVDVRT